MLNKLKELRESREEGFTLIELLVVIVIIGVLAAIALPIFLNQQKAAIQAGVKSDVRNTVTAVATALVKAPTAGSITIGADTVTSDTVTAGAIVIAPKKTSDSATTLTIGSVVGGTATAPTTVTGAAKWDNYKIAGTNTSAGSTAFVYVFDSTTGKYASNDAYTPAAPVTP